MSSFSLQTPVVLTIAGSDSSSGAGIQADLKTCRAFDVYGLNAITCVVSETAEQVRDIHPIPVDIVASQIELLLGSYPVKAIKLGMLWSKEIASLVADKLEDLDLPIVLDPVMIASSGDTLIDDDTISVYKERLIPMATVITPNLPEAHALLGLQSNTSISPEELASRLHAHYQTSIALKGGHDVKQNVTDYLHDGQNLHKATLPRINIDSSHGTGCTFAAALTAEIANGKSLAESFDSAKNFVHRAISHSHIWYSDSEREIKALDQ